MTSLGFENYAEALKIYLSKYREVSAALVPSREGVWLRRIMTDLFKTQSTRGEQQRPGSQGFGSTAAGGSGTANASSSAFQGGPEGTNNILGPQGEGGDHDAGSYGNLYGNQVSSGHNGATGGEGY